MLEESFFWRPKGAGECRIRTGKKKNEMYEVPCTFIVFVRTLFISRHKGCCVTIKKDLSLESWTHFFNCVSVNSNFVLFTAVSERESGFIRDFSENIVINIYIVLLCFGFWNRRSITCFPIAIKLILYDYQCYPIFSISF